MRSRQTQLKSLICAIPTKSKPSPPTATSLSCRFQVVQQRISLLRNRGYDAGPVYTRDGKFILYRSQATAGFEADRWRLMAYNRATGTSVELTRGFDLQVEELVVSPDGNSIYFTAADRGKSPIFKIPFGGGVPQKIVPNVFATNLRITPDGKPLSSRRVRWRHRLRFTRRTRMALD